MGRWQGFLGVFLKALKGLGDAEGNAAGGTSFGMWEGVLGDKLSAVGRESSIFDSIVGFRSSRLKASIFVLMEDSRQVKDKVFKWVQE